MNVIIEITCDNAAFDPDHGGPGPELARALRTLAAKLEDYPERLPEGPIMIRDTNGNVVGGFRVGD